MMRKLLSALILAGIAWAGQVAFAADGTITFAGAVSSDTCTVNGGVAGSSFTVVLPPIASASLAAVSASAGRTPFDIVLSACSTPSGAVHTFFEAGLSTDSETGHLKNTGGAGTGVQIRLLNGDETRINAGFTDASQNSRSARLVSNAATLSYFAEYVRVADIVPGTVASSVVYSIVYE